MLVIVLIIILVLAFGGGGGCYGYQRWGPAAAAGSSGCSRHSATLVCIRRIAPAQLKLKVVGFEHLKGGIRTPRIAWIRRGGKDNRSLRETLGLRPKKRSRATPTTIAS